MKQNLIVVTPDEQALWQAFVEAKEKAERSGAFADAIEAKRCLKVFFCHENPVIQQNLGVI